MAHTKGRSSTLDVGGTAVGGITSLSDNLTHDDIDETDFDSAGWKETAYGESQVSLSVTLLKDEADAGQDLLRAAATGKTTLASLRYRPVVGAGSDQVTFTGKVSSRATSSERNADVEETYDIVSSGAPTFDTQ